jgi:small acid-soluble spore protein (thioredoxin-like protein)
VAYYILELENQKIPQGGTLFMAKPDDRSDNVEHLQEHIQNTIGNLEEAEDYLDEHADEISGEEINNVAEKNERRRESIEAFREEVIDEAANLKE